MSKTSEQVAARRKSAPAQGKKAAGYAVEMRPLSRVKPYPDNPRANANAVEKVAASLKEFGWRQAIVVDEQGVILAGHTRREAALSLGWTEAPVHVARGLSAAQARAYRLMDNRAGQEATWDEELLTKEILALQESGKLEVAGFDDDEIARLVGEIGEADLGAPPPSVEQNVERLQSIQAQRKKGNANVIEKSDTEHYIVLVFPDRASRESTLKRLGLPHDERYVDGLSVELRHRVGGARESTLRAERSLKAAPANKSGATG